MKKFKAFTLVEVVIAITVISVTMVAVYGLIISVMNANQRNLHNLQASYLAAEGLEVFRFMRDSNWLGNYSWDTDFHLYVNSQIEADWSKTVYLYETEINPYWSFGMIDNAAVGEIYFREFLIEKTDTEKTIQVTCTVSWDERGIAKTYALSTFLSDWND